jgi:hypothetical protein
MDARGFGGFAWPRALTAAIRKHDVHGVVCADDPSIHKMAGSHRESRPPTRLLEMSHTFRGCQVVCWPEHVRALSACLGPAPGPSSELQANSANCNRKPPAARPVKPRLSYSTVGHAGARQRDLARGLRESGHTRASSVASRADQTTVMSVSLPRQHQ